MDGEKEEQLQIESRTPPHGPLEGFDAEYAVILFGGFLMALLGLVGGGLAGGLIGRDLTRAMIGAGVGTVVGVILAGIIGGALGFFSKRK